MKINLRKNFIRMSFEIELYKRQFIIQKTIWIQLNISPCNVKSYTNTKHRTHWSPLKLETIEQNGDLLVIMS